MDDFERIRRLVLVEGISQREVARQLGIARKSVRKAVERACPIEYTLKVPRACPILDSFKPIIDAWLDQDRQAPRKQRHSGARVHERLVAEHDFQGSLRSVSRYVSGRRKAEIASPVFAPMDYPPGFEIQIDWGEGTVVLNGHSTVLFFFCARLPFSKATFVRAYAKDDMPSFLDAHNHLFQYLHGVPGQLAYDNLKSAVIKVLTGRKRILNRRLVELKSHYLFQTRFCNVASGNEKGHVENSVKRTERTYLTPIPHVMGLVELNVFLMAHCVNDLQRVCKQTGKTYGELLGQETLQFRRLPVDPFLACVVEPARIDKQSTVIHNRCRYSVPVRYARQHSRLRIYAERIEILIGDEIVVSHERGEPGQWRLEFEHYIPLLDRKPGWLESALPFQKVRENPTLSLLRRELEYRHGECGVRQFIAILQLIEHHTWEVLLAAIERCVHRRVFHEQAVLLELQTQGTHIENPAQTFSELDLSDRPELAQCGLGLRSLSIYDALLINEQTSFTESMGGEPNIGSFDTSSSEKEVHHLEKVTNNAC
jgi:transposase